MSKSIVIGEILEPGKKISRCPSYYAADYEVLELKEGSYPLSLSFSTGFVMPMPDMIGAAIEAMRVEGKLYSGFGGFNYSARDLPVEPVTYHFSTYCFHLPKMVEEGSVILKPGFELLLSDRIAFGKSLKWGEGILA